MNRRRVFAAFLSVAVSVGLVVTTSLGGAVYAAQTSTVGGNALKVSPVRLDLTMDPGTSKTTDVYISNLTNVPATLHVAINDFMADANESGQPNIILDENQSAPTHSIKQFIAPLGNITIPGNTQKDVKVTITVPRGATGGGYYGAVRFYPPQQKGEKILNLSASVGSLLLLKVNGTIQEQMNIASFDVRRGDNPAVIFTSNKGLSAISRFKNTGNVQLEPFGAIQLKRFGKVVGSYHVNDTDPRGNVLPDSIRRFETKLDKVSAWGKYTLSGNFGYGTTGQLLTASKTFYVVPATLLITAVSIVVAVVLLIIFVPKMLKSYNRRVIRKATGRR